MLELKSELKPKDMSEEVAKTTSLQILNDNKPSLLLQFTKFETIEEAFDVNEEEADQKSK